MSSRPKKRSSFSPQKPPSNFRPENRHHQSDARVLGGTVGIPSNAALGTNGGIGYGLVSSEPVSSGLADKTELGATQSQAVPSCAAGHLTAGAAGLTTANGFTTMSWPGSWWQQKASDRWALQRPRLAVPFWDSLGTAKEEPPWVTSFPF